MSVWKQITIVFNEKQTWILKVLSVISTWCVYSVSRICAEPPPVTLSVWQMLAPCVTPRGAAPWSKTTASPQPSPLLMSSVSCRRPLFGSPPTGVTWFVSAFLHLPPQQDMCSTCRTITWRRVPTCLGNCRTTTWCHPRSSRSIARARGLPAVPPSSLNSLTAATVSFCDLWPASDCTQTCGVIEKAWGQSQGRHELLSAVNSINMTNQSFSTTSLSFSME